MSLALYIDENVHAAITNGLRCRGIDALTIQLEIIAQVSTLEELQNRV